MAKRLALALLSLCAAALAGPAGIAINGAANDAVIAPGLPVILSFTSNGVSTPPLGDLEALGPDGARASLTYRPAASAESALTAKLVIRTDVWTLSPDGTANLTPGRYAVKLPSGEEAHFTIGPVEEVADRLLLLSTWAEIDADKPRALELARQWLADQPASVAARLRLSDLLADGGELAEALKLLDEAEMQVRQSGARTPHPPVAIRARQAELLERMTAPR